MDGKHERLLRELRKDLFHNRLETNKRKRFIKGHRRITRTSKGVDRVKSKQSTVEIEMKEMSILRKDII